MALKGTNQLDGSEALKGLRVREELSDGCGNKNFHDKTHLVS